MMARPTKLTPATCKTICDNVTLGMPYEFACTAAGVSYDSMRKWVLRAEAELMRVSKNPQCSVTKLETPYVQFLNALKESEAKGIRNNLAMITKAAKGDDNNRPQWQAGAWILERRHPEQFAKHEKIDQKTEHSGGVSIQLNMKDCSKKEE